MIGALITLVVYLVIAGLIWWAATAIIAAIPMPEPIRTVVRVIMIVIVCLICLYALLSLLPLVHAPALGRIC